MFGESVARWPSVQEFQIIARRVQRRDNRQSMYYVTIPVLCDNTCIVWRLSLVHCSHRSKRSCVRIDRKFQELRIGGRYQTQETNYFLNSASNNELRTKILSLRTENNNRPCESWALMARASNNGW